MPIALMQMRRVLTTSFFLFALLLGANQAFADTGLLEIHFLSIGQGDGILLRSPTGKTVLLDVGPPGAGRRIITPYMRKLGIKRVNLLMISHPHLDHYGGWKGILRNFPVNTYIDPGFPSRNRTYRTMLRAIKRKRIRRFRVRLNQVLDIGGGAKLRILWPGNRFLKRTRSDANSNSVVARLEYKTLRVLLTGDAEAITEKELLHYPQYLRSHVLKVAHHGSSHSSGKTFLKIVKPQFAIISCGRGNVYRHPHRSTLRRLRRTGVKTYVTARHGHIVLRSDGRKMWLSTNGKSKREARHRRTLSRLNPIPYTLPTGFQHPLHVRPEKKGWINVRAQGKHHYHSQRVAPSAKGYVSSRRSRYFHRRNCRFARDIPRRDRRYYRTRRAALRRKIPATDCHP
jgi:beta-lactamase superfamily II metal-dependent hydrolase